MLILLVFVGLYNDVVAYPDKRASYPVPVRLPRNAVYRGQFGLL